MGLSEPVEGELYLMTKFTFYCVVTNLQIHGMCVRMCIKCYSLYSSYFVIIDDSKEDLTETCVVTCSTVQALSH
jgi:hypothetical protein